MWRGNKSETATDEPIKGNRLTNDLAAERRRTGRSDAGESIGWLRPGGEEDYYVRLAREGLEYYICNDWLMPLPEDLPPPLLEEKAGVFVSLKKHGSLRGCIGTIMATQENLAMEIMYNAISAGTKDARFLPVTKRELPALVYRVDIVTPPIPLPHRSLLDCRKYGVVVIKGNRRGLLLPDLEGVDTVDEQIEIACHKAGIDPEEDYKLEYFQVIRHE